MYILILNIKFVAPYDIKYYIIYIFIYSFIIFHNSALADWTIFHSRSSLSHFILKYFTKKIIKYNSSFIVIHFKNWCNFKKCSRLYGHSREGISNTCPAGHILPDDNLSVAHQTFSILRVFNSIVRTRMLKIHFAQTHLHQP